MTIPFFWVSLGFTCGILIWLAMSQFQGAGVEFVPGLSSLFKHLTLVAWSGFLFGLPLLWFTRGRKAFLPFFLMALTLLGFLYADGVRRKPDNAVEFFAERGRVSLEGVVKTAPEIKRRGKKVTVSFVLSSRNLMRWVSVKSHRENPEQNEGDETISVIISPTSGSWARNDRRREFHETEGDVQVFLFNPPMRVDGGAPLVGAHDGRAQEPPLRLIFQYGDRVRMWGKLEKPRPALNPGQFDYGGYLSQKNIGSVFIGFGEKSVRKMGSEEGSLMVRWIEKLRAKIERRIEDLFGKEQAPIMKALILGKRKEIEPRIRDILMKTSTAHLLAISGLHIALVVGSLYCFLIVCGFRQKAAAVCALSATVVYMVIAGFGIPVRRAGWMAGMGFLALLLERERNALNIFFLAFFMLLLAEPLSLTQISFQLSFLSVFSLIMMLRSFSEEWQWAEIVTRTGAVMVGTFPLVVYYFNVFSPVSIFANLLAIPFFHLALLSAFLSFLTQPLPFIGEAFVWIAEICLNGGLAWIRWWANVPWGYFYLAIPSCLQIAAYYLFFAAVLFLRSRKQSAPAWVKAVLIGAWFVVVLFFFRPPPCPGLAVTLLAAGKNEIAHLRFGSRTHWLVNTGRRLPSNQADWIVGPYLRSQGIKNLSGILVTDFYKRHVGGLETILYNFSLDNFLYPASNNTDNQATQDLLGRKKANPLLAEAGDQVEMKKGGRISILCVVRGRIIFTVSYRNHSFLFLPLLNGEVVEKLRPHQKGLAETDVLALPAIEKSHLGDLKELFQWIDPLMVAIPHQQEELRMFLHERDIPMADLETYGALTFEIKPQGKEGRDLSFSARSFLKGAILQIDAL